MRNRDRKTPLAQGNECHLRPVTLEKSFCPWRMKFFMQLLLFRCINSLLVQTMFNPDEYWQSLEVAHNIVFGYGHLTWEWKEGLRSFLHPLIFSALYKILLILGIDFPFVVRTAPGLLQAVFAAMTDFHVYILAQKVFQSYSIASWALACNVVSWFTFFCITRTFSSCLEASLTVVALSYWPSLARESNERHTDLPGVSLWLAALSCAIRPTSLIVWTFIGLWELKFTARKLRFIFLLVLPIGSVVLLLSTALDWVMYGGFVFVPWNFVRFNVLGGGAAAYGSHPWHWYFSNGFPAMLATLCPFCIHGMLISRQRVLAGLVIWTMAVYSLQSHKEFRFLLPVLPIGLIYAGCSLDSLSRLSGQIFAKKRDFDTSQWLPWLLQMWQRTGTWFKALLVGLFVTQAVPGLYFCLIHQRGSMAVMQFIESEHSKGSLTDVLFLMPCHSTPFYSHVHRNVPMAFLDCSPNAGRQTESDRFLMDPVRYTEQLYLGMTGGNFPSHVLVFEPEDVLLSSLLKSLHYAKVKQFFHCHVAVDRERQGYVAVYKFSI